MYAYVCALLSPAIGKMATRNGRSQDEVRTLVSQVLPAAITSRIKSSAMRMLRNREPVLRTGAALTMCEAPRRQKKFEPRRPAAQSGIPDAERQDRAAAASMQPRRRRYGCCHCFVCL